MCDLQKPSFDKAKHISQCLELAILLESSAEKPGNVNRRAAFQSTRYEHFLASAVALSSSFERAAELGHAVAKGKIQASAVGIGRIIKECMMNINAWQHGGNTLLGTAILLSPLAVAAGMAPMKEDVFAISELRKYVKFVVESTTSEDAVNVYEAIRAGRPGGLGTSSKLDVNDPRSIKKIREENISLYMIFKIAEKYDRICSEWVNNYPITFDFAYPSLVTQLGKRDLGYATVHTFLSVLAEYPDTLIARKTNNEKAESVSRSAKEILKSGFETRSSKARLREFDTELRRSSNLLNPGTTADIIAAALALSLLGGYRP
jgi:triphosphoribosyl-dephospho-CoA synthase